MKKTILILIFSVFFILLLGIFLSKRHINTVSANDIGKNDLLVRSALENLKSSTEQPHITDDTDFSWDNIGAGKDYYANGQYAKAVEAFKRAYSAKYGSKAVAGLNLARSYEKTGQYEEGVALLDLMIKNSELSEKGIQNANDIKSRLVTAKAQSEQNQPA